MEVWARNGTRDKENRHEKDDSVDSGLLFKEEDILKMKKEKSPWSIRTDCVFAWLGVVVLGSFFSFPFLARLFLVGNPEWSGENSR
jgi:hypothetical protein